MTTIQVLSLVIFVAVLVVSVWLRLNVGAVAFPAVFLLASIAGVSAKKVLGGFPGNLVVLIIGITLLFAHAQRSGAIDWMIKLLLRLIGSRRWLIPWVGFVLAAVLGTIGGLPAAVVAIVIPVVAGLARSYRMNYFMMAVMANWAAIAAGMSPLSPAGALFRTMTERAHLQYSPWALYAIVMGALTVLSIVVFIVLGGFRLSRGAPAHEPSSESTDRGAALATSTGVRGHAESFRGDDEGRPSGVGAASRSAFDRKPGLYRTATLVALVVLVVLAVGFRLNIGLVAISLALLLQIVFRPPEKEMLSKVAWPVVLLLAGLLIYLNLLGKLGTLDSIQSALHGIGVPTVTILVLAYVTALFSNMDSSTIVVLGVMAPIGLAIVGGSSAAVLAVLVTVATATAVISMSPVHIDGSLIIANTPNNDEPQLFRKLIYLALVITAVVPGLMALYPILVSA